MLKVKISRFHLLRSGDGAINCSGSKTRQHVLMCRHDEGASNKVKSYTKKLRVPTYSNAKMRLEKVNIPKQEINRVIHILYIILDVKLDCATVTI